MKSKLFRGTGVALITPFQKDGSVDDQKLRELVEFQITNGTEAILPAGRSEEFGIDDSGLVELLIIRIIVSHAKHPCQAGVRDEHRRDPVVNQAARHGFRAVPRAR